jgi:hypothetical protein
MPPGMGHNAAAAAGEPISSHGLGGSLLGTRRSSAGGPTSTKILLARPHAGATPLQHRNRHLQVCKRCYARLRNETDALRDGARNRYPAAVSLSRFVNRYGMKTRALLAVLAVSLVLNGIAYLTHDHAAAKAKGSATHTELCGYCAAFGGLGGAPADLPTAQLPTPLPALIVLLVAAPLFRRHVTAARPRAPPTR